MAASKTESKAKTTQAPKKTKTPKAVVAKNNPTQEQSYRPVRREMTGTVVSDKMQKTIVVKVDRRVRHGLYGKYLTYSTRYKAHDENNTAKAGDLVVIVQSRPLSRDKRWALKKIVRKGSAIAAIEIEA